MSLLFAVISGVAIAIQARITGALSLQLENSPLSAAVTFGSGLLLMLILTALSRQNREGVVLLVKAAIQGKFPWVFVFSGILGAFAVYGQAITVEVIGVALFSLIFITGQMFASALLDTLGWVPAGRQHLGYLRIVGLLAALVGVLLALLPKLVGPSNSFVPDIDLRTLSAILPLFLVFIAGLFQPPQMAINGAMRVYSGSVGPLVLFNYLTGTLALLILTAPSIISGSLDQLPMRPDDWWYYTGGLLGSVVVISGAVLTRTIGSLLFTLGLVAGQLSGSLGIDVLWPIPGTSVVWQTFLGATITLLALLLASASRLRR